jgi:hypothetical protein
VAVGAELLLRLLWLAADGAVFGVDEPHPAIDSAASTKATPSMVVLLFMNYRSPAVYLG